MKLLKHILVLAIIAPFLSFGQDLSTPLMKTKVDVVYLSSDLLEGRATASMGEQLASEYIISRFKGLGLRPAAPDGTWMYPFMYREKAHPHDTSNSGPVKTGHNVLSKIDNGSATTVIVGAHYDHLGMGGPGSGSLAANEIAIHNGADDNASGVAAMLAIAEKLKNNPAAKNNNYLFIAFSGEELGLYGSNAYSKDPAFDMTSINYMINLDMVGRLGTSDKTIAVSGVGTSSAWKPMLENNAVLRGIKISATESGQGPSDHTSFYLRGIPVLHLFTGQHKDYHKPSDDAPLINYEGILEVADLVTDIIESKNAGSKLDFIKTKDESGRRSTSFKVTMGIMPDYLYQDGGIRLDGVTDGKPAALAGLKQGDIVLKVGDTKIMDMNSYMEVLGKHEKGDKVKVLFKRDGKEQELDLVF